MAFADSTAYKAAIASPKEILGSVASSSTLLGAATTIPAFISTWSSRALGGSTPSTAAACDRTTSGALGQQNGGASQLFVCSAEIASIHLSSPLVEPGGCLVLADRLSHQGGLAGNTTSTQTTNLPTAALTRYTSGAGVWAAIEIYTILGSTIANVTVSYTNQAGTAGQIATATLGTSGTPYATFAQRQMALLSLASGDTGIRSVESVTLSASTGSAGNFGITLFKPLLFLPMGIVDQFQYDVLRGTLGGGIPEILDDACLYWLWSSPPIVNTNAGMTAMLSFAEA